MAGFVAAASCAAIALMVSRSFGARRPVPVGGLAIVTAALLALDARGSVPIELTIALAGIGIVCAVPPARLPPVIATVVAIPFALLLASDLDPMPTWTLVLVVAVASAGAVSAAATDELWRQPAVTPLLLAITAAATYVAVPDTEEAAVLLGVALPFALLGWPVCLVSLGRGGAGAAIALVVWTAATGGRADPASVVGALASVALLAGLSVGHRFAHAGDASILLRGGRVPIAVWVVSAQALLALVASRVGAAGADTARAVVMATLVTIASAVAGATLRPPR